MDFYFSFALFDREALNECNHQTIADGLSGLDAALSADCALEFLHVGRVECADQSFDRSRQGIFSFILFYEAQRKFQFPSHYGIGGFVLAVDSS